MRTSHSVWALLKSLPFWAILGSFVVAGVLSAAVAVASGTTRSALSDSGAPASKLAIVERERELQAAAAMQPHGVKHPEQKPVASCPIHNKPLIYPFRFGPFHGGKNLVNVASVESRSGVSYTVFAGALDESPQQGVLLVLRNDDPCASAAGRTPSYLRTYLTPKKTGAVTIIALSNDAISFVGSNGLNGTFNYVTGQFS